MNDSERYRSAMRLLVERGYPFNGAAGIVGNLIAESGVITNRVEGSLAATPQRSRSFYGKLIDWTPREIMTRDSQTKSGPKLPGVGIAQWTSKSRRDGLFAYRGMGEAILFDLEAQIDYLVSELRTSYLRVNTVVYNPSVSIDSACDEVVYNFEIPGAILSDGKKLPRDDYRVQAVFAERRRLANLAAKVSR